MTDGPRDHPWLPRAGATSSAEASALWAIAAKLRETNEALREGDE